MKNSAPEPNRSNVLSRGLCEKQKKINLNSPPAEYDYVLFFMYGGSSSMPRGRVSPFYDTYVLLENYANVFN